MFISMEIHFFLIFLTLSTMNQEDFRKIEHLEAFGKLPEEDDKKSSTNKVESKGYFYEGTEILGILITGTAVLLIVFLAASFAVWIKIFTKYLFE